MTDALAIGVHEAAERLGLSERTVWTLVARGELPCRRIGRRRLFRIVDLEKFLTRDHPTGQEKKRPA